MSDLSTLSRGDLEARVVQAEQAAHEAAVAVLRAENDRDAARAKSAHLIAVLDEIPEVPAWVSQGSPMVSPLAPTAAVPVRRRPWIRWRR